MHQLVPCESNHLRKADTVQWIIHVNVNGNSGIIDTRDISTKSEGHHGHGSAYGVDEKLIDGDDMKEVM